MVSIIAIDYVYQLFLGNINKFLTSVCVLLIN